MKWKFVRSYGVVRHNKELYLVRRERTLAANYSYCAYYCYNSEIGLSRMCATIDGFEF